jgi:uncharacterized membrane protein
MAVRLLGHPVHPMAIHFPVALWPTHLLLHLFDSSLPAGVAAVGGFWLLAGGTAIGWMAAFLGAADLLDIAREAGVRRLKTGIAHAAVNGAVLVGFTGLLAAEYVHYPSIRDGAAFLSIEACLIAALVVGNFLGGELVWRTRRGAGGA